MSFLSRFQPVNVKTFRHLAGSAVTKAQPMAARTVNQDEVNKFKALSDQWWDPNGPLSGLHSMNSLRVPFVRDGLLQIGAATGPLAEPLSGLKILDVGCGGGILSERLARLGAQVTAIDPVADNIMTAIEHSKNDKSLEGKLIYKSTTVEQLLSENPECRFDAVVASEVIEHVDNPEFFVETCTSLLNPGGSFFLTTISRTTFSWLGAIIAAEYILKLLPAGTHDWKKFISPQELKDLLEKSNMKVRLTHGMFYIPGINKWTWFPDTSVNYAMHAVKK